jgi:hypothetical protein
MALDQKLEGTQCDPTKDGYTNNIIYYLNTALDEK